MSTGMLLVLCIGILRLIALIESRDAQEEYTVRRLVRAARKSKPRQERNPARFGTVGYKCGYK